jgi:hypothetical protein
MSESILTSYLGLTEVQSDYLKSSSAAAILQEKGWISAPTARKVRVKQEDGTFGNDIYFGTEARYVDMENGNTLEVELESIKEYIDTEINNILGGSY